MKEVDKLYSNGEVTIRWRSGLCIHSARCIRGLPSVFDTRAHPWIKPEGATTEEIIAQVEKCPSGALTWFRNGEEPPAHPAA